MAEMNKYAQNSGTNGKEALKTDRGRQEQRARTIYPRVTPEIAAHGSIFVSLFYNIQNLRARQFSKIYLGAVALYACPFSRAVGKVVIYNFKKMYHAF